jgi:hypothetical protein
VSQKLQQKVKIMIKCYLQNSRGKQEVNSTRKLPARDTGETFQNGED